MSSCTSKNGPQSIDARMNRRGSSTKVNFGEASRLLQSLVGLQTKAAEVMVSQQARHRENMKGLSEVYDMVQAVRDEFMTIENQRYTMLSVDIEKIRVDNETDIGAVERKLKERKRSLKNLLDHTDAMASKVDNASITVATSIINSDKHGDVSSICVHDSELSNEDPIYMDAEQEVPPSPPCTAKNAEQQLPPSPPSTEIDADQQLAPSPPSTAIDAKHIDETQNSVTSVSEPSTKCPLRLLHPPRRPTNVSKRNKARTGGSPVKKKLRDKDDDGDEVFMGDLRCKFVSPSPRVSKILEAPSELLEITFEDREVISAKVSAMSEKKLGELEPSCSMRQASKIVASLLEPHYQGVSEHTIRRWTVAHNKKKSGDETIRLARGIGRNGGRSRICSDQSLARGLQKIANHDRSIPLSKLDVLLEDARTETAKEQDKSVKSTVLSRRTKTRYTKAMLPNCEGTMKADQDTNARRSAVNSVRNSMSNAALVEALQSREIPEFGLTKEEAARFPVRPELMNNADPTTVVVNGSDSKLELMIKHVKNECKHKREGDEQEGGSGGGGQNTQSIKVPCSPFLYI